MIKASNKVRASVLAATFGLFLATTTFATTSSAATIKNGVTCKKAGLKTKSGGKNYVCGKNPYVTPTKNTPTGALSTPNLSELPVNWLNLLKKVLNRIDYA